MQHLDWSGAGNRQFDVRRPSVLRRHPPGGWLAPARLRRLAERFLYGALAVAYLPELGDEAVIERPCRVDGIGRWTAEMLLIFHLTRPDVLPVADQGLRREIGRHYAGGAKPTAAAMRAIAEPWRPWRSVAVWYLWRSLDAVPVEY